jgi:hypothetical protein
MVDPSTGLVINLTILEEGRRVRMKILRGRNLRKILGG